MKGKRLLHTLRLWTIPSGAKRAEYLRNKKIFAGIGKGCTFMERKIPLYANLIRLGDNVHLASGVTFVTHDVTHKMLNNSGLEVMNGLKLQEKVGCIELGNNVFVGAGVTILYDVKIGSNVIIGAGSVVTKDIPDNSIVAGVPAKVITTMDSYIAKRRNDSVYSSNVRPQKQEVGPQLEQWCWEQFKEKRV